jgi:GAF domain-containing protein
MATARGGAERAETTRLRDFVRASGRMAGALEPAEIVTAVLDAAIQMFALEACSIGVLDSTGKHLRFSASRGRARVDEFEVDAGLGIAGYVAKTGRGQLVNDVANDERFYKGVDQRSGFRTRALLCAPLRTASRRRHRAEG